MYATTCELAGAAVPSTVEFPSLVPLLHGGAALHDAVFCRYIGYQRSVRTKRHKLIVYPQVNQVQLFDLAEDPWETHNLADDPAHADVRRDLWDRLLKFQKELDDPLVLEQA